jgi:hypothetical protein
VILHGYFEYIIETLQLENSTQTIATLSSAMAESSLHMQHDVVERIISEKFTLTYKNKEVEKFTFTQSRKANVSLSKVMIEKWKLFPEVSTIFSRSNKNLGTITC